MDHILLHRRLSADLAPATLYALLRLRVEVLVVEQVCPYQDLDDRDLLFRMQAEGDAAAVVVDADRAVGVDRDRDALAIAAREA